VHHAEPLLRHPRRGGEVRLGHPLHHRLEHVVVEVRRGVAFQPSTFPLPNPTIPSESEESPPGSRRRPTSPAIFSSTRARILLPIAPGNGEEEPPPRTPAGVGFQSLAGNGEEEPPARAR
jgi:hypothetical protein